MLLEACAGLLDSEDPEETIRREVEEETGFRIAFQGSSSSCI